MLVVATHSKAWETHVFEKSDYHTPSLTPLGPKWRGVLFITAKGSRMPDTDQQRQLDLATTLRTLVQPGKLFELRFLASKQFPDQTHFGYFDDYEAAAANALAYESLGFACYWCLNPIRNGTAVCITEAGRGRATSDKDVLHRDWLLVDADPVRPAGVSSTKTEKLSALQTLVVTAEYLKSKGWGWPLVADSGNGYHALYRVALPSHDKGLVKQVLRSLSARFDNDAAEIDTTVYNASRICRLYGTKNSKGEDTPERPHRYAKLLRTGDGKPVAKELLEVVAADNPADQRAAPPGWKPTGVKASKPPRTKPTETKTDATKSKYENPAKKLAAKTVIKRARAYIATLPAAIEGQNGSGACFHAACVLVKDFALSTDDAYPLLEEYNQRCKPPWSEKQLRHKLKDATKKAEEEPEKVGRLLRDKPPRNEKDAASTDKKQSNKGLLQELVECRCELWHTPDECEPYASVRVPDHEVGITDDARDEQVWHTENVAIESNRFSHMLASAYLGTHGTTTTRNAIDEAVFATAAKARYQGTQYKVHVRVAEREDAVYLDLANKQWEAVVVDAAGWRVVADPPAKFRRPRGMLALPTPARGGSIDLLRPFVNVGSQSDYLLLVAWLVMTLRPKGPYPLLSLHGEQGNAKSTTARVLRRLVDPCKALLRRFPKDDHDLMIAANNSWTPAFDNLSYLSREMSDALCQLSTGGGYATRQLYTDSDEAIFDVTRPVLLTSVNEVTTRADLLDRTLVVQCPAIDETKRRTEEEFWAEFETVQPQILGVLLDGVATALASSGTVVSDCPPRMADFANWAAAAMPAWGWDADDFQAAYRGNIATANNIALDDSVLVPVLRRLLAKSGTWPKQEELLGAEVLLRDLNRIAGETKKLAGWPQRASSLALALRRLAPVLRRSGIEIEFLPRQTSGGRSGGRITPLRIHDTNWQEAEDEE